MKKMILSGLVLVACATPSAFSAEATPTNSDTLKVSQGTPAAGDSSSNYYFSFGAGLGTYAGNTGLGLTTGVITPVADGSPLFFGGDLGLVFWNNTADAGSANVTKKATGIQLLPSLLYRFDLDEARAIHPYLGLSAGPTIHSESVSVVTNGVATKDTSTKVLFTLLFRPGFYTNLTKSIALDINARMGTMNRDFIFLPTASLVLAL